MTYSNKFTWKQVLFFIILLFGLFFRFFLAFKYEATGDAAGWIRGVETVLEGRDLGMGNGTVYDFNCSAQCVNWPPFTLHIFIVLGLLFRIIPFEINEWGFYKVPSVLADFSIVFLLYYIAKKYRFGPPRLIASLYALHPIAMYVSGYHGQRDSIWLFFTILSMIALTQKKTILAGMLLGVGISFKLPPIFLIPYFFLYISGLKNKILYLLSIGITFFILNLPELVTHFGPVYKQVFSYKGWLGWWGFSGIATKIDRVNGTEITETVNSVSRIIMYASIILVSILMYLKKRNIYISVLTIILSIFIFSPVFASQYLIWPLPFVVLIATRLPSVFVLYSLTGTYVAATFYTFFKIGFLKEIFIYIPERLLYGFIPFYGFPIDMGYYVWFSSIFLFIKMIRYEVKLPTDKKQ